jgi:hypothetical protein
LDHQLPNSSSAANPRSSFSFCMSASFLKT